MNEDFERFLLSPEQDRKNVFGQSAIRLGTRPKYIEKDLGLLRSRHAFQ